MGTIFAPTYANLTIGYHKIWVYSVIRQSYPLASIYFENSWFGFLDDCQILLKVNLIKSDHLLSILNQIDIKSQFTMEKSQTRLSFLDKIINKSDTNCPFTIYKMSYLLQTTHGNVYKYTVLSCKKNMHHENENGKEMRFKDLKKTLLEQKYRKSIIEASISKAKE